MRKSALVLVSLLVILSACKKKSNSSVVPAINFTSLTPDSVKNLALEDTVFINFHIVDGDGDLTSSTGGVYLKDSRFDSAAPYRLPFPDVPTDAVSPKDGLDAICTVRLAAGILMNLRPDHLTNDTLSYELYIVDGAGHESNHVQTSRIYIHQ